MPRTTKTITISLPPEVVGQINSLTKKEGRTRTEVLCEALRRYAEDREWKALLQYGQKQARKRGITKDQVEDLVDAIR